ncbi:phosphate ABC transporter permease PstA [Chitinivibrio alkaliphilus]|uniref:Phosphate transport system permease protein PstA n=1 Tax=Chitinivibrio alkaliphilus ACht1 TaxID=1313304 RepID=U7D9D2_9BACT|nr:phosphate ABC transporter permease PstA [Chitinivibrio alkaliphilus]ERP31015.1 ABC-type phosphate transport system, permease component PstA [Chitinivibrio alkaliphilus ACht1]
MKSLQSRYRVQRAVKLFIVVNTVCVLVPLFLILYHVFTNGIGAVTMAFFTEELGSPTRAMRGEPTGLVHTIIGTFVLDFTALIISLPFGLGAGMLLSEYPDHPLNAFLRIMTDTLNGMPAVLKGLLAWALVVKPMGGFSGIAGGVALAFVMLPILARSTESALMNIPWSIREAGLAIGLPRWRVVLSVVMPASKSGLVTGGLIAFARAAGEAAPLLFTSFGNNYLPNRWTGWFFGPVDSLPQRLYSLAISPYKAWHEMGWAAGLVLIVLVMLSFAVAKFFARERTS